MKEQHILEARVSGIPSLQNIQVLSFSLNPGPSSVWPNLGKERTSIMINDNFSNTEI